MFLHSLLTLKLTCLPAARVHHRDRAPGTEVQGAGVKARQACHPLLRPRAPQSSPASFSRPTSTLNPKVIDPGPLHDLALVLSLRVMFEPSRYKIR